MLFRYWRCRGDACSAYFEDVVVLTDAAPVCSTVGRRGRPSAPSLRQALAVPSQEAAAIAAGVPRQLVAWGLPADSVVPVAHLPHVLVELVTRRMWHTLMWRCSMTGGLLLRDVLDFPPRLGAACSQPEAARARPPGGALGPGVLAAHLAPVAAVGRCCPGRTGRAKARGRGSHGARGP